MPIHLHHVRPAPRGGGSGQQIPLCANAHGRVHSLLDFIEDTAVTSPYRTTKEVLRSVSNDVWATYSVTERAIAYHGWLAYGGLFLSKRYTAPYAYWRTDGSPKGPDVPHFNDLYHAARWSKRWRRELDAL